MGYWREGQKHSYHHTGSVNSLCGLRKALLILAVEGLEFSGQRHMKNYLALQAGLDVIGLIFVVSEAEGLPQPNLVGIPDGVDEASVRSQLLRQYNLKIGSGLGTSAGKVWRIALMGYASNPKKYFTLR